MTSRPALGSRRTKTFPSSKRPGSDRKPRWSGTLDRVPRRSNKSDAWSRRYGMDRRHRVRLTGRKDSRLFPEEPLPPQVLRDYQAAAKANVLQAYRDGARSALLILPTGAGKTTVFGDFVSDLSRGGIPSLTNVHRRELATQAANRFREFGIQFGFIMAGEDPRPAALAQIASVMSLVRRGKPRARVIINDEAHLSTANTWTTIIREYPDARILGVTATPWRLSGKPLASLYDRVIVGATPAELRDRGFLCRYSGFSFKTPDLEGVGTTADEYNSRESEEVMSESAIVDNIVEEWLKYSPTMSTVVFAVTVKHSKTLCERFRAAGVAAEHLDGNTPTGERLAIMRRVEQGITRVLCNVGVAVEGLDIPRLKCCVLARPTKSLARAIQMMGRVRRMWATCLECGQEMAPRWLGDNHHACTLCGSERLLLHTARIHDHAFTIAKPGFGLPDDPRDYSLDAKKQKEQSDLEELHQCKKCHAWFRGKRCTECQAERKVEERIIATVTDAEQWEFKSGDEKTVSVEPLIPKERPARPTVIRWETPGRIVEGTYLKFWDEPTSYGSQRHYLIRTEERDYNLPGTTVLNQKMAKAPAGAVVRITYTGETGRRKEFTVGVDNGQPEVAA